MLQRLSVRRTRATIAATIVVLGLLFAGLARPAAPAYAATTIVYVVPSGAGAKTGANWANAKDLAAALTAATSGTEIWIKVGTYRPTVTADRTASFTLKSGVALYGGFAGNETQRDQRDWLSNVTILSGDIGAVGNSGDNSYHVVIGATGAMLDGVTITAGNANGSSPNDSGGGMYNSNSNPMLTNVTFSGNAAGLGGGMSNYFLSSPTLSNVSFSGNAASYGGGMANNDSSHPTLINVSFSGNTAQYGGGGIDNHDSYLTLTNGSFSNNTAPVGGGMENERSKITLTNVIISGNTASMGGGMYNNNSSPTLTNVTISGNSASGNGGGIYSRDSNPTLINVIISGNAAQVNGGGMYNASSSSTPIEVTRNPALTNVILSSNTANYGGGMYNYTSNPTLINVTLSGNTASMGGGMNNNNSNPTLTNVILSGNAASDSGGGMYNYTSNPMLTNVTISGNMASRGGGMDNENGSNLWVRNSILWGDSGGEVFDFIYGAAQFSDSIIQGGYPGVHILNVDPQFVQAVPTVPSTGGDLRLRPTSQAIDSGNDTVTTPALPATDRDGRLRLVDIPGISNGTGLVDLGAYEIEPILYVDSGASAARCGRALDGLSWVCAYPHVYDALSVAPFGWEIWIQAGTYKPTATTDRTATFRLKSGVALYGGFAGIETQRDQRDWLANVTILSGDIGTVGNTSDNSYHVVTGASGATLDGVTITGGNANSGVYPNNRAAGVYNYSTSPTLANLIITGNSAIYGAGIFNDLGSTATLSNVTISGNSATSRGGGVYNYGSNPTLTNVTINSNTAPAGGGMYNDTSSPTLTNVILSGNAATPGSGGGMYNDNWSSPTLTNVTLSGNTASMGGGMYNNNTSGPHVRNSILWGDGGEVFDYAGGAATISDSIIQGGYPGVHILNVDPQFVQAVPATPSSGGDLHLNATSPAIDAGNNAVISPSLPAIDRDGKPRKVDFPGVSHGSGLVDLGAFEFQILYVVPGGAGAKTGADWANARDLAPALTSATSGSEIWIKAGSFTPSLTDLNDPRAATFRLKSGVALYGGFAGTETQRDQRDWAANVTILSGDIGAVGNNSDNSYHVVTGANSAILDGITITRGNANSGSSPNDRGGGIYNDTTSPTLTNVTLSGNSAYSGGGMFNNISSPTLTNVTLSGNSASYEGGGMNNYSSSPTLTNVTISGNSASSGGGMANWSSSHPQVRNSILWGDGGGEVVDHAGSATTANDSIVQAGCSGIHILNVDPQFVQAVPSAPSTGGDLHLRPTSPAIDAGNDVVTNPALPATDRSGTSRIVGAHVDLGAYEALPAAVSITSSSADGSYKAGSTIAVQMVFNMPVNVSGTPQLTLETGASDAVVSYSGGSGTNTLVFGYTVAAGQSSPDLDYLNTNALALGGGTIRDVEANLDAALALPSPGTAGSLGANKNLVIDTSAPVVGSIMRAGTDPTNAASVQYTVTFKEPVSGGTITNFSLTTTGVTGASITGVTGTGATRTVTVSTGTGTGTIRLDLTNASGIADLAANGLVGVPFTFGQSYAVDKTAPTVSSIVPAGADPTNAASVQYTVTFNEPVTGGTTANFGLTTTGLIGASITDVTGSGATRTVTVSTGAGDGTIRLDLTSASGIADLVGNPLDSKLFTTGHVYTVDKTAPKTMSIVRAGTDPTNATSVQYIVTFNEPVIGGTITNFSPTTTGVTGASIIDVTGSGATRTVTVGTGSGSGTIRLDLTSASGITDLASNVLTNVPFRPKQFYTVDKTAPAVVSIVRADTDPTSAASVQYTVTFNEVITGGTTTNFSLTTTGITGASVTGVAGSGATRTVTVSTSAGSGTLRLDLTSASEIADLATNGLAGVPVTTGEVYTVDKTAPTVVSIVRAGADPTNAASVQYTVTFSEPVTGGTTTNFSLTSTGVTGASVTGVSGSGATRTVTVSTGSGSGTIRLDLTSASGIADLVSNALASTPFTAGQVYTVDRNAPTIVSIVRSGINPTNAASVQFTVTFSEVISGGTTTNFNLTSTGVTGASVTGVSGSGATRTVTVDTGTGSGTIRLDLTSASGVTDLAGNALSSTSFTAGLVYTIDKAAPTVVSIVRASADPTNAASVQYTVTFNEPVTGVAVGNFTQTRTGVTGAGVTSVTGSGTTRTVTADTGSGSGTIRLDLTRASGIVDQAGNMLAGVPFTSGQSYTIDKTAPTVISIVRAGNSSTNAASLQYTVTFNEPVTGGTTTNFSLTRSGVSGASITGVTGSGATRTVTVSTGTGSGTIRLNLASASGIADLLGNPLAGTPFTTGETYTIDKAAPTVVSIVRAGTTPTNAASVQFTVTFSEVISGGTTTNFNLTTTGVSGASVTGVSGSGATRTVTVSTGSGLGTLRLDLTSASGITDLVSNLLSGTPFTSGQSYAIDKAAPTAVSIVRASTNPTSATSVWYTVTFNESVTGGTAPNFSLTTTGVTGASITGVTGSGATRTVTVSTGTGSGTIRLDLTSANGIADLVGNVLSGTPFTSGQVYTVDKTALVASIAAVVPSPRPTPITSLEITFSASVTGVDLSDVSLTRDSIPVALTGATLTGSGASYTLGNLSGLTAASGSYVLTLAAGSGIVDGASKPLAADATTGWTVNLPTADWSSIPSMGGARALHTTTLLPNGTVLVAGGAGGGATAELYDPATGIWSATGSMAAVRYDNTATLLPNGKVLIAGGWTGGAPLASAELYDPATGTWSATGSMASARYNHTATLLLNGTVLVVGGSDGGISLQTAELYDPATGTWSAAGSLSASRREAHTATLLPDGTVLVAGGYNSTSGTLDTAELYDPATGTWSTTGNMAGARYDHTATLLPGGTVLVAGGVNGGATAELYDPTTQTWSTTGPMSGARSRHTATLLPNGLVLVAGGVGGGATAELYDLASGAWATAGSMAGTRSAHTATLLPSGLVLIAGGDSGGSLQTAELFSSGSGGWSATGAMDRARYEHSSTLLANGMVLVAGGSDGGSTLPTAELYNPASSTWSATGNMAEGREKHVATLLPNGKVLVVGGANGSTVLNTAELYDPASGTWSATASMAEARYYPSATLLATGKVLVVGGWNGSTVVTSAELYDPASGTWSTTGSLTTARQSQTATLLPNGEVLIAGGWTGGAPLASAELYDPAAGTWSVTGSLAIARYYHSATLLPNGTVLVAGGSDGGAGLTSAEIFNPGAGTWSLASSPTASYDLHTGRMLLDGRVLFTGNGSSSAKLYDPNAGTWSVTGSMLSARSGHAETLLPNGQVLVSGGVNGAALNTAELYDAGLGFQAAWRPTIATAPALQGAGPLTLTGVGFRGISEASSGSSNSSDTDYPLVQLRTVDGALTRWLSPEPAAGWTATTYTSLPVGTFPNGPALLTVFVNGIPSQSAPIQVDTTAPAVMNVTSSTANGSYKTGDTISVQVVFDEAVTVIGTPQLTLETGASDAVASYSSGDGTTTLTFDYTVAAGQSSANLDYLSTAALALGGGKITDAASNVAVLTLPSPGAAGSLGVSAAITIDTSAPTVGVDFPMNGTSYNAVSWTGAITGTAGDDGSGLSAVDLSIKRASDGMYWTEVDFNSAAETFITVSGTASWNYTLTTTDLTDGDSYAVQARATDLAGNQTRTSPVSFTYDDTTPTVSVDAPSASLARGGPVSYSVTFSGASSYDFDASKVTLNQTGTANGAVAVSGSSPSYTVTLSSITGDGTLGITIQAASASDVAGNTSAASAASTTFTVDNTAPVVSVGALGPVTLANWTSYPLAGSCTSGDGAVAVNIGTVNASVSCVSGSFSTSLDLSGLADGSTVSVAANQTDGAGNTSSDRATTSKDTVAPTVTMSSTAADPTNASPIAVIVTFSDDVSGFTAGDITAGNATVGSFVKVDGMTYTFELPPSGQGAVTADIAANVAQDAAGNGNTAATQFSRTYDTVAPTAQLHSLGPISLANLASYPLAGSCTSGDGAVAVNIGTVNASVSCINGSFSTSLDLSGLADGSSISVDASQTDSAGNSGSDRATTSKDTVAPTVTMSSTAADPTNASPIAVTVTFSDDVSGFTAGDISITNATLGDFSGSGASYSLTLTPLADGPVSAAIGAGVAADAVSNLNSAATPFSRTYDHSALAMSLASSAAAKTNVAPIPISVSFGKPVADFTAADLTLTNATVVGFNGSGASYSFTLAPLADGLVSVAIAAGAVHDNAGNASGASSLSRIYDSQAPRGLGLGATSTPRAGADMYSFTLLISDNLGLDLASLGDGDVSVSGPHGFSALATFVSQQAVADGKIVVTVRIPAPGGSWDGADTGVYSVRLQAGTIADLAGNRSAAAELGSFSVTLGSKLYLPLVQRPAPQQAGLVVDKVQAASMVTRVNFATLGRLPERRGRWRRASARC